MRFVEGLVLAIGRAIVKHYEDSGIIDEEGARFFLVESDVVKSDVLWKPCTGGGLDYTDGQKIYGHVYRKRLGGKWRGETHHQGVLNTVYKGTDVEDAKQAVEKWFKDTQ